MIKPVIGVFSVMAGCILMGAALAPALAIEKVIGVGAGVGQAPTVHMASTDGSPGAMVDATTPEQAASSPNVVRIPEVLIMGDAGSIAPVISLPEMVIGASPTPRKSASRHVSAPARRSYVHTLHQGGRPGATSVRVF